MKVGNYEDALTDYLQLLNEDPRNESYNYNVGVCYLNNSMNKRKAVPYLEIVLVKKNTIRMPIIYWEELINTLIVLMMP
jgi:tetratricopeptide (TPR) repeat protein